MNKIYLVFIASVFFAFNLSIYAQYEKATVLTNAQALFGNSVDKEKNLLEVNKDYNLHLIFQNEILIEFYVLQKDKIPTINSKFRLDPKFGKIPVDPISGIYDPKEYEFINQNEFDDIISKLNSIKPFGKLIYENEVSLLLNNKIFWYREYENATLKFNNYSEGIGKQKDRCITDIIVYFPETVVGEVITKEKTKLDNSYRIGIKFGESYRKLYRVTEETYKTLKLKKTQTFKGIKAGSTPIYN